MKIILVVCGFSKDIMTVYSSFCLWGFGCLCLACRAWSGYESAGPLGAWVGMKVLDPLRACVKIAHCCDPSSTCTLTCVKMLVTVLRIFCHRIRTIRNSGSFYFILVRTIRSSLHCIKSPDQRSLIIKFKNIIFPLSETKFKPESFTIMFHGIPLTPHVGWIQRP
jgi:hypothetical protein